MATWRTTSRSPTTGEPSSPIQAIRRRGSTDGSGGGAGGTKWPSSSQDARVFSGSPHSATGGPVGDGGGPGADGAGGPSAGGSGSRAGSAVSCGTSGVTEPQCATISANAASTSSPGSGPSLRLGGSAAIGSSLCSRASRRSVAGDPADELDRALEDRRGVVVEGGDVVAVLEHPLLEVDRRHRRQDDPTRGRVDDPVRARAEQQQRLGHLGEPAADH